MLFPEIFVENVNLFKGIYKKYNLDWKIFFACKSNKWKSFINASSKNKIWVDVSSIYEMKLALWEWILWENISISWPNKNKDFLFLAVKHSANIVIDSLDEVEFLEWL
jgi:diaminopimelate decarboxylase